MVASTSVLGAFVAVADLGLLLLPQLLLCRTFNRVSVQEELFMRHVRNNFIN